MAAQKLEGDSRALEELLATLAQIEEIDLSKFEKQVEAKKSAVVKAAEQLENLTFKRKRPKKPHWRTVQKKKRERERIKYLTKKKPARALAKAKRLREEGWYGLLKADWEKRGISWEIGPEEWQEAVGSLDAHVPLVTRYASSLGVTLDNVLIRDRDTLEVLFCGKEHKLRKMGYII